MNFTVNGLKINIWRKILLLLLNISEKRLGSVSDIKDNMTIVPTKSVRKSMLL